MAVSNNKLLKRVRSSCSYSSEDSHFEPGVVGGGPPTTRNRCDHHTAKRSASRASGSSSNGRASPCSLSSAALPSPTAATTTSGGGAGDDDQDSGINALPDELLALVFAPLDLHTKACVLPLVCPRWAAVLRAPSEAWAAIDLWDVGGGPPRWDDEERRALLVAWLEPRCGALRQLDISFAECLGDVLRGGPMGEGLVLPKLRALRLDEVDVEASTLAQVARCAPLLAELQASIELGQSVVSSGGSDGNGGGGASQLVADLQPLALLAPTLLKLDLNFEATVPCPPCVVGLTHLQRLGLHNVTSCVPHAVVSLPSLRSLALGINADVFPRHLGVGTQLTQLSVSFLWGDCPVVTMPEEIGGLTGLRSLRLSDATVLGLGHISTLTGLTSLKLAHLRLTAVPPAVSRLTNLQELDLTYNRIRSVPEFAMLPSLQRLHLRCQGGGGAMALPPNFAARCANLHHLCMFPGCKPLPVTLAPHGAAVEPIFEGNKLQSWKLKLRRLPVGHEAAALKEVSDAVEFLSSRCRSAIYCSGLLQ